MYVQSKKSVNVCFVRDKEADGKRHINGRPAQGDKLLGDRQPCSPWQQWCRQPALGYRQPSTETNNQPTD